jgi:hypothetical protein
MGHKTRIILRKQIKKNYETQYSINPIFKGKIKKKKTHPIQSAKPVIRVNKDNFIECKLKEIIKSNSQPT